MNEPSAPITPLVVARGAASALIVGAPAALANSAFAGQDDKSQAAVNITYLLVIVAFAIGGFVAGLEAPGQAAKHGALAGLAAFVPIEVIAILGRLDRDAPIKPGAIIFLALLAACAGTVGAQLGARRRAGRSSP